MPKYIAFYTLLPDSSGHNYFQTDPAKLIESYVVNSDECDTL